jgi:hypothetical protein
MDARDPAAAGCAALAFLEALLRCATLNVKPMMMKRTSDMIRKMQRIDLVP